MLQASTSEIDHPANETKITGSFIAVCNMMQTMYMPTVHEAAAAE